MIRLFLTFALLFFSVPLVQAQSCPRSGSCTIAEGRYVTLAPETWDGTSPLPALFLLHGYNETPESYLDASWWLMDFVKREKVLLILPEGKEKTWSYAGSPMENRDDTGFIAAVLKDVETRYPLDRSKLMLSGFSQGGSMVWYAACALGSRFKAYAPFAGAFWEPQPERCSAAPINLFHVHGTADNVVPMTGRPIGDKWRQGNVVNSMATLARDGHCEAPQAEAVPAPVSLDCRKYERCDAGTKLQLCLHDGGHRMMRPHFERAWAWMLALPKS